MNVSRQDASDALDEIAAADRRARQRIGYREASPFLILWGLVWLTANAVTDLVPALSQFAWPVGSLVGFLASGVLVFMQLRRTSERHQLSVAQRVGVSRRVLLLAITTACFFPAMLTVLAPLTERQQNAFISLSWAFTYMVAGAWLGTRMFITGLVLVAAILLGYLFVQQHFLLWMAVVGGGSLLLAGFWLRKI